MPIYKHGVSVIFKRGAFEAQLIRSLGPLALSKKAFQNHWSREHKANDSNSLLRRGRMQGRVHHAEAYASS